MWVTADWIYPWLKEGDRLVPLSPLPTSDASGGKEGVDREGGVKTTKRRGNVMWHSGWGEGLSGLKDLDLSVRSTTKAGCLV